MTKVEEGVEVERVEITEEKLHQTEEGYEKGCMKLKEDWHRDIQELRKAWKLRELKKKKNRGKVTSARKGLWKVLHETERGLIRGYTKAEGVKSFR